MSAEHWALLAGLFLIPALLLALGHRLRRRRPFWRGVFWGAVAGHSIALLVMLVATLVPPVAWQGGSGARDAAVYWSLVLGSLVGGAVGGALYRDRRSVGTNPEQNRAPRS